MSLFRGIILCHLVPGHYWLRSQQLNLDRCSTCYLVIQVLPAAQRSGGAPSQHNITATSSPESAEQPSAERLILGRYSCALSRSHLTDRATVERAWKTHLDDLHLREPFERIREAITEAQRPAAGPASGAAA